MDYPGVFLLFYCFTSSENVILPQKIPGKNQFEQIHSNDFLGQGQLFFLSSTPEEKTANVLDITAN